MMTNLHFTQSTHENRADEHEAAGYPHSPLLRMMLNASRRMAQNRYPRLDPEAMSETMKRDLGFVDWGHRPCQEG